MNTHPDRRVVQFGPSIGACRGKDIPAWIQTELGRFADYVGVAGPSADTDALKPGQSVIAPGLIYEDRR